MIVAVASGKGGTGKTTIASNLSSYIGDRKRLILADLDVEEPNTGIFLKGECVNQRICYKQIPQWDESACTLCGQCTQVCNFNAVVRVLSQIMVFPGLCHSCYACSELCPAGALPMRSERIGLIKETSVGSLKIVESRLDIGQEQAVPLIAQTKDYIENIRNGEDFVILDSPPGTSCPVIEATRDADMVILVTEPTPFGLHDLDLAVSTMRKLGKHFVVVLNRDGIGDDRVVRYCEKENIEIIARVKESRGIAQTYSRGELIWQQHDFFREEIEKIYSYLLGYSGRISE